MSSSKSTQSISHTNKWKDAAPTTGQPSFQESVNEIHTLAMNKKQFPMNTIGYI